MSSLTSSHRNIRKSRWTLLFFPESLGDFWVELLGKFLAIYMYTVVTKTQLFHKRSSYNESLLSYQHRSMSTEAILAAAAAVTSRVVGLFCINRLLTDDAVHNSCLHTFLSLSVIHQRVKYHSLGSGHFLEYRFKRQTHKHTVSRLGVHKKTRRNVPAFFCCCQYPH